MPSKHPVFREIPSWQTVLDICQMLQVPTEFPATIQKSQLNAAEFISAAAIIEPYYIPCKARLLFEGRIDASRWITVLKHMFQPHGYTLISKETTRDKKKTVFYTIERSQGNLKTAVSVDFS